MSAPVPPSKQVLILCDEQGVNTGYAPRAACHQGEGLLHRAIMVIPRDGDGRVLLQQRKHQLWDGYWDLGGATHPLHAHPDDETDEQAATRCLRSEWNVDASVTRRFAFRYRAHDPAGGVELEYCSVFDAVCDPQRPKPNPDVAYGAKWLTVQACAAQMAERPNDFTPWAHRAMAGMTSAEHDT